MAGWQSGYAAVCKAVYAGSSPAPASFIRMFLFNPNAWVAELVDARDLKSLGQITCAGSSPALGTRFLRGILNINYTIDNDHTTNRFY